MGRTRWAMALVVVLAVSNLHAAAQSVNAADFREAAERFVHMRVPDARAAARIRRLQPIERIPAEATPAMAAWGAGPLLQREVERLLAKSASRPEPSQAVSWAPNPTLAPPIDGGERALILETIRLYAEDYSHSIPNFLCLRDTRFFSDDTGLGRWKQQTHIGEKLSHLDGEDEHQIVEIDGKHVDGEVLLIHGGITVSGEFGNVMRRIFEAASETAFFWLGQQGEGAQAMVQLGFRVDKAHSSMRVSAGDDDEQVTGYAGVVTASADTGQVFRIRLTMDELPEGYPMRGGSWDIHYGPVKVEEHELLLPVRAVAETYQQGTFLRNEATYSGYQRYSSDSNIRFGPAETERTQAPAGWGAP